MSYHHEYLYSKGGGETGGGGGFPPMRISSQQQQDPKQSLTLSSAGGVIPYPQHNTRPTNQYVARPRMAQRPQQHMMSSQPITPQSTMPYSSAPLHHMLPYAGPMAISLAVPAQAALPPSNRQGNYGGSGGGGGSGGVPPQGYYTPQQPQIFMQHHPQMASFQPFGANNPYAYQQHPGVMSRNTYGTPNSGTHTGVSQQPPSQQPTQQYMVDGSVGGSGNVGGGSGNVIISHPGGPPLQPQQSQKRRPNALPITDPDTGRNIMEDFLDSQTQSGESSTSVTPQSLQNENNQHVAAEFAAKVAAAAVAPDEEVVRGGLNGPNTPPPSHSSPFSSAIPIHSPPIVQLPPATNQRLPDPQPPQVQLQPTPIQPHPPHHTQHPQIQPTTQIPTVSANTNSPTVEIPRSKASPTVHSPHRKPTPVPSTVQPILDTKKKEKKVTGMSSVLPPHREEPEDCSKSSFANSIDIKNLQTPQLPPAPPPATSQPAEPETNGEPEVTPPVAVPVSTTAHQPNPKHEKQEQSQPQHERGNRSLQRQRQKKKQPINRGKEKDGGSDMDAFTSTPSPAPAATPVQEAVTPTLPAAPAPVPEPVVQPPVPDAPEAVTADVVPQPPASPSPPPPASAPVSITTTILPSSLESSADNEQDEGLEQDMEEEEEEDDESLLVAKNNEVNASLAPSEVDESMVIETTVIGRTKVPSLKYNYKEGMWSPLNPEGKKVYDREFLLILRSDDLSTKRPDIDDCDIIKTDSANNNNSISATNNNRRALYASNSMSMNRGDGFAPPFMRSSSSQRGGGSYGKSRSQQGRPGPPGRSKGLYPSSQYKNDDDDLHWAAKGGGWKPERCKTPPKLTEEEQKTENLYKKVRGILNKLTPQKFEKLMDQILELPIDTHERLKGVVELVFDKAVDEPSFSRAYAKLCYNLSRLHIKMDGNEGHDITSFKTILLNKCQHMFEKKKLEEKGEDGRKSDDERIAELQKQVSAEANKEKKKELQLILEEEERKIRVKYVGLARFIGELFKLQMLTPKIMHNCIKTLLEKIEEESLECLCKLLTTVGKDLENQSKVQKTNSNDFDEYFAKMRKLSQKNANSKVSSRVRFMLQDVIELRSKNWVPRRDENNPKTMEQIQQDAEREAVLETVLLQQANTPRSKHNDRDDRRRLRGAGNQNNNQDADGWTFPNSKFRNYSFEPSKLQHIKGMDNEPSGLSLGSHAQFSQWNSGSSAKRGVAEPKRPELVNNKFAALISVDEKKMTPMMRKAATLSSSMEKERGIQGVHEAMNRGQRSNPPSRDNSRVRGAKTSSTPQPPTSEQPVYREKRAMSPDRCMKESKVLFEEWLTNQNIRESVDSIKETFSDPMQFVHSVIEIVFEGKSHKRISFGDLLAALLRENVVTAAGVSKELTEYISCGEDLVIDIPLLWQYLADFLAPIMAQGVFTFADLKAACATCRTPLFSATLSAIINQLLRLKGPSFIKDQWEASKVKFSDFIPESDVDNFIKSSNCGFIIGEGEVVARESDLTMAEIEKILHGFLTQDDEKMFDQVCEWVKANVGSKAQDVDFIRVLTRAIIRACIRNEKIVPGSLNKHSTLIKKFVDVNETRELACLNSIQQLIVVQMVAPSGLLLEIFQFLYENGLISYDAFMKWKTSCNEEGKGVAVKSLSSFFVSLSEQDEESDEEST